MRLETTIFRSLLQLCLIAGIYHGLASAAPRPHITTSKAGRLLTTFVAKVNAGYYGRSNRIYIQQNGIMLAGNTDLASTVYPIESVTKSLASLVLGIALKQGKIKSLKQKVLDYFPSYKKSASKGWGAVTIEDLLLMKSGINWNEGQRPECINPTYKMYRAKDMFTNIFSCTIDQNKIFNYSSANAALLSEIIYRATGYDFGEYANKVLFTHLGIRDAYCHNYKNGRSSTSGGLWLCASDLLKIGQLCLNRGKWKGQQVVSEDWLHRSFYPYQRLKDYADVNAYGLMWWIHDAFYVKKKLKKFKLYMANGYSNNHLILVPELNLVAVINAKDNSGMTRYPSMLCDLLEEL